MPSTRVRQNLIIIGIFAAVVLFGLVYIAINTGQRIGPLPPQQRVSFSVRDADGLPEGADVRIAGVGVGKVIRVYTTKDGAMVEMGIDPQYLPIYTDATVLIRPKSLLGEKYVDMNRGSSNVQVPDGGSLPASQAATQVETDQVLLSSDEESRKALSVDIISLGQGVKDRGHDINPTIPELRRIAEHLTPVSARFKDRTAQIDHILVDTDTILTTLADEQTQLAKLLQTGDSVTGTIAQNDQHLAGLLTGAGNTLQHINAAVGQQNNDQNIRTALEQTPPTLTKLQTFVGLLNKDINTAIPSLLLGQQYTYPADQLTISHPGAVGTAFEWDSGSRQYDSGPTRLHGFTAFGIMCDDNQGAGINGYICPNTYDKGGGYGTPVGSHSGGFGTGGASMLSSESSGVSRTATAVSEDVQRAFLEFLLGR